jgi:hypothetical protein
VVVPDTLVDFLIESDPRERWETFSATPVAPQLV